MAKLFEQGGDVNPELSDRVASGRAGQPTKNHTWQKIVAWLNSVLDMLKKTNNLSDLTDKAAARANLDVSSTSESGEALNLKADKTNVLELNQTDAYTPQAAYNPATKKYNDDTNLRILWSADISATGAISNEKGSAAGGVSVVWFSLNPGKYTIAATGGGFDPNFTAIVNVQASDGTEDQLKHVMALSYGSTSVGFTIGAAGVAATPSNAATRVTILGFPTTII